MEINDGKILKTPKVFVSYSRTNQLYATKVLYIAKRLVQDGIDVVLDKWNLNPGEKLHQFMESCISDETIDAILICSDKIYKEKANTRSGGVGTETTIITSEIYDENTRQKFLPIVLEKDEKNKPFLPTYIKDFIYFDFSNDNNLESELQRLIMFLYGIPEYQKPELGNPPKYLFTRSDKMMGLQVALTNIKNCDELKTNKIIVLIDSFTSEFEKALYDLRITKDEKLTGSLIVEKIDLTKEFIDIYLDCASYIITTNIDFGKFVSNFIERIYNSFSDINYEIYTEPYSDHYKFLVWEMFLSSVAIMYHFSRFDDIKSVIDHTYNIRTQRNSLGYPNTFIIFQPGLAYVDEVYKKEKDLKSLSCTADIMSKRSHSGLSNDEIAFADVFLCQLSAVYSKHYMIWFPLMYPYDKMSRYEYSKFRFKTYCESIMHLFNANSIDDLRINLNKARLQMKDCRYPGCYDRCSDIIDCLSSEDDIGKIL